MAVGGPGPLSCPSSPSCLARARGQSTSRGQAARYQVGERDDVVDVVPAAVVEGPAAGDQPQLGPVGGVAVDLGGGEPRLGVGGHLVHDERRGGAVPAADADRGAGPQVAEAVEDGRARGGCRRGRRSPRGRTAPGSGRGCRSRSAAKSVGTSMLPSAARPRSTNVEVCTPIEGMSRRTGGEPGRIGPEVDRPGRLGRWRGRPRRVRAARRGWSGTARLRRRAVLGWLSGRWPVPAPRRSRGAAAGPGAGARASSTSPREKDQHDGGRRGEQSSAAATVLGGLVHQLRARARRAVHGARAGGHEQQATAQGDQAGVGRARGAAGAGGGTAGRCCHERAADGRVGRLGGQARVEVALGRRRRTCRRGCGRHRGRRPRTGPWRWRRPRRGRP